jgi:hypothetical protein
MMTKENYIKLFRDQGFNCFPLPFGTKVADKRYQASRTMPNQLIHPNENYGVIPNNGTGTAIIDFDHKKFEPKLKEIAQKYMLIETRNGFHLPVRGLTGKVGKAELFDYSVQPKKIIEIQGPDHYVVGCMSEVIQDNVTWKYENIGTDVIIDQGGMNFDDFIDKVCQLFGVEGRKRDSRSSNQNLRTRFKEHKLPAKGTSNDYFFQAALYCNTEGYSKLDTEEKLREIYNQWTNTDDFSQRPWSNIQAKIDDVYDNDLKLKEGRPFGSAKGIDRVRICEEILASRKIYSNVVTDDLYEDKGGYIALINDELKRELLGVYKEMEKTDLDSIKFKLVGLSDDPPKTNKDLIYFKDGKFSKSAKTLIETDDLADIGFKDYNYLEPGESNEPKRFLKIMFENIPDIEIPRVKAGLKAILSPYLDPKISVIQGEPRVGKSTALLILHRVLGEYSTVMEMEQLLEDSFIKAHIKGKRLVVLQDLPQNWKDFTKLKTITGEQYKTERGFMQDSSTFENKIKVWASSNYLAKIPEKEKAPMYARLSLIHNTRTVPHEEDPTLIDSIVEDEAEKIVSWIVNIPAEECIYEKPFEVRQGWEALASPEIDYISDSFEISEEETNVSVMKIKKQFEEQYQQHITIKQMGKTLEEQGFIVKFNVVKNIKQIFKEDKGRDSKL